MQSWRVIASVGWRPQMRDFCHDSFERLVMRQALGTLTIDTHGKGLVEITDRVADWVANQGIADGLLTLFCRHTSASLVIRVTPAYPEG